MEKNISIADKVYGYLEEAILSGEFQKGEVISELKICKLLEVSRTPVREALTRLFSEGLLKESGRGAVVVGIDRGDIDDIYEIRMRIEGLAASKCANVITPEQKEALREVLELQEFYIFRNQHDNVKKADSEFHRLIYSFCGSKTLEILLSDLLRKVKRCRMATDSGEDIAESAVKEHREIFEAIASGNCRLAEELTVKHVLNAKQRLG